MMTTMMILTLKEKIQVQLTWGKVQKEKIIIQDKNNFHSHLTSIMNNSYKRDKENKRMHKN